MNQEIKAKWVAALRSGKYEQGNSYLCSDGKFCCLGVLTDLYAEEKGLEWTVENDRGYSFKSLLGAISLPPWSVQNWADIDYTGHLVNIKQREEEIGVSLVGLNDMLDPLNFNQIADIIEYAL